MNYPDILLCQDGFEILKVPDDCNSKHGEYKIVSDEGSFGRFTFSSDKDTPPRVMLFGKENAPSLERIQCLLDAAHEKWLLHLEGRASCRPYPKGFDNINYLVSGTSQMVCYTVRADWDNSPGCHSVYLSYAESKNDIVRLFFDAGKDIWRLAYLYEPLDEHMALFVASELQRLNNYHKSR